MGGDGDFSHIHEDGRRVVVHLPSSNSKCLYSTISRPVNGSASTGTLQVFSRSALAAGEEPRLRFCAGNRGSGRYSPSADRLMSLRGVIRNGIAQAY